MRIIEIVRRAVVRAAWAAATGWRGFAAGAALGVVMLLVVACSGFRTTTQSGADKNLGTLYELQKYESSPKVRVRLARGVETAEFSGPPKLRIESAGSPIVRGPEVATPFKVTVGPLGWEIRDPDGPVSLTPELQRSGSLAVRRATASLLNYNDTPLAGDLLVHRSTSLGGGDGMSPKGFDVVEQVSIDLYLPGVLAKELYSGWGLETYKAQAIAARSYALHERQRRMAQGDYYDLESTTKDQAYGGATDRSVAHKAVDETLGLVLMWRGGLLRAYYSSTTAGRAASARDIWPTYKGFEFNLAAPIQASPRDDADSYSPLYRWEVKRPASELSDRLRDYGAAHQFKIREIGTVRKIDVVKRNEFDRPTEYRFTDQTGKSWTLSSEHARVACNNEVKGLPAITKETRVNSGDFEASLVGDVMVIKGRGFGHGVGMSQYGAEGMARKGADAKQILMYYYPGSEIVRLYQ